MPFWKCIEVRKGSLDLERNEFEKKLKLSRDLEKGKEKILNLKKRETAISFLLCWERRRFASCLRATIGNDVRKGRKGKKFCSSDDRGKRRILRKRRRESCGLLVGKRQNNRGGGEAFLNASNLKKKKIREKEGGIRNDLWGRERFISTVRLKHKRILSFIVGGKEAGTLTIARKKEKRVNEGEKSTTIQGGKGCSRENCPEFAV